MSQKQTVAPQNINIASRDMATAQQINTLLGIANSMMMAMGSFSGPMPSEVENKMIANFGPAAHSAEETFCQVCRRLDKVLGEDCRWDDAFMRRVEKALQETHDANMKVAEENAKAVAEVTTPHFQYRPNVQKTMAGYWIAYLGDLSMPEACIMGAGMTAEQAIEAFDGAFKGNLTPFMQDLVAQRVQNLEHGGITSPDKGTPNDEELDERRNSDTENPPQEWGGDTGDSQAT